MVLQRLGHGVVRLASASLLLGLVAGIPAALTHYVGWPLPRRIPADPDVWLRVLNEPFPDAAVINLLAVALWITWAMFSFDVAAELVAAPTRRRRGRPTGRSRTQLTPTRALAALLVAGLATGGASTVVAVIAPPVATVAPAVPGVRAVAAPTGGQPTAGAWLSITTDADGAALRAVPAAHTAALEPVTAGAREADLPRFAAVAHTGPLVVAAGGQHYTVTVQRGDTLWDLARTWLGDPHRWPEIYHLNADRYDHAGRMHGGNHIEPTWVLALPDDATPPAGAQPATPPQQQIPTQPTDPTAPSAASSAPAAGNDADPAAPVGTSSTTPSSASASTSVSGTPAASTADPAPAQRSNHAAPAGVAVLGGWLDAGLVAALLAAVALVWAHRRRRYTRRPPSPDLRMDDPALAPMPSVIAQVRHGLRRSAPTDPGDVLGDSDDGPPDSDLGDVGESGLGILDDTEPDESDWPEQPPSDDPDPDDANEEGVPREVVAPPVTPALGNPTIALWPPTGLGLTGPGAEAAARGFLVASLAAGGLDDPDARSQVIVPAATLATLLGADAVSVPDTPRLMVTAGLPEAVAALEEATLHRTRMVYDHEVDTVAQLRAADPAEEPLPPMVLIADTTAAHQRARVAAALVQGQRLDIHGVLLGAWPQGDTVVVAADGTTTPASGDRIRHGAHPADLGRLAVVDPDDAADLLRVLGESHTGEPQPTPVHTPPRRPQPVLANMPAPDSPDHHGEVFDAEIAVPRPASPDDSEPVPAPLDDSSTEAARIDVPILSLSAATPAGSAPGSDRVGSLDEPDGQPSDEDEGGTGRATVRILGAPRIMDVPTGERLRPQAVELLVYLALHDHPVHQDLIFEDLMPDATVSKAPHRLDTYIYNLRRLLRGAGGKARYLYRERKMVALNPEAIDCDLWRMRAALATAAASSGGERVTALRQAVDTYTAPLADSRTYPWVESYREAVRLQALDATLALVDALDDDPEQALAVARAAVAHHPHTEDLTRAIMRVHARLDDAPAVRAALRALGRRLEDIDAEPTEPTLTLADELLADLDRRARRTGRGGQST